MSSTGKRATDHNDRIWSPRLNQYVNRYRYNVHGQPTHVWSENSHQYVLMTGQYTEQAPGIEYTYQNISQDADFKVHDRPERYFVNGRVFEIPATYRSGASGRFTAVTRAEDAPLHSTPRRFVVFRAHSNRCDAIPILTYWGRGVSKEGITKSDHAIIHTSKKAPKALEAELPQKGERGMRPNPIQVLGDTLVDVLPTTARLNFGRIYEVDHTIPVKPFGQIASRDMSLLTQYFHKVWAKYEEPAPRQLRSSTTGTDNSTVVPSEEHPPSHIYGPDLSNAFPEYVQPTDPASFFVFGRVFAMLWTEDRSDSSLISHHETRVIKDAQGRQIPVRERMRRFVVISPSVNPGDTTSQFSALPIHTYRNRGVAERDVIKSEHCIIHTGMPPPEQMEIERPNRREEGMRPDSVRVIALSATESLDRASRLNFGSVHSITLDSRVKPFGVVHPNSYVGLWTSFRAVQVANYPGLRQSLLPPGLTSHKIRRLQKSFARAEASGRLKTLAWYETYGYPSSDYTQNNDGDDDDTGEDDDDDDDDGVDDEDQFVHSDGE